MWRNDIVGFNAREELFKTLGTNDGNTHTDEFRLHCVYLSS